MTKVKFEDVKQRIEVLKTGNVLFTTIREVANDKYQLEFREKIKNPNQNSLLGDLNIDDDRFSGNKSRVGWVISSLEGLRQVFNINLENLNSVIHDDFGKMYAVGILNPVDAEGNRIRLQLKDRLFSELDLDKEGDRYKIENVRSQAKQNGKGDYFLHEEELIFQDVIPTTALQYEHRILEKTSTTVNPEAYVISVNANITDSTFDDVEESEDAAKNALDAMNQE